MTLIQRSNFSFPLRAAILPIFLAFFITTYFTHAHATFTITSIGGGASDSDITLTTPIIYASLGSVACTAWDGDSNGDPETGCAVTPIPVSSNLEICFTHNNSNNINVYGLSNIQGTGTQISPSIALNNIDQSGACAKFTWASICAGINDDDTTACTKNFEGSFYLVGDTNGGTYDSTSDFSKQVTIKYSNYSTSASAVSITSGAVNCTGTTADKPCILKYGLVPGDGKAIIYSTSSPDFVVNASGGWPKVTGHLRVKYIRFYFSETTTAAAVDINGSNNFVDIEIDESGNFSRNYISGLTNDRTYAIRAAVIDEAGSVGYMLDAASTAAMGAEYDFVVTPAEVFGVFEESRCFIATAAYGNGLAPKLKQFRAFRDEILLTTELGRKFVRFYYANSPRFAAKILEHPTLQKIAQVFLWPAWAFSSLALIIGFTPTILVLLATLALIIMMMKRLRLGGSKL